jgi:putative pre-16S rRNA nuclease
LKSNNTRFLAIDYGSRRIGIAVSDETNTIAFGRGVVENTENYLEEITKIVREENISDIVIGYPLSLRGNKSAQTVDVEDFENELRNYMSARFRRPIDIIRWDERLTSKMAADSMLQSGMKKKNRRDKKNIDIISAALILQSYLDNRKLK